MPRCLKPSGCTARTRSTSARPTWPIGGSSKQHYADGDLASPKRYAEMVAEDRKLSLAGYEVYRFGGAELHPDDRDASARVQRFFDELLDRYNAGR